MNKNKKWDFKKISEEFRVKSFTYGLRVHRLLVYELTNPPIGELAVAYAFIGILPAR